MQQVAGRQSDSRVCSYGLSMEDIDHFCMANWKAEGDSSHAKSTSTMKARPTCEMLNGRPMDARGRGLWQDVTLIAVGAVVCCVIVLSSISPCGPVQCATLRECTPDFDVSTAEVWALVGRQLVRSLGAQSLKFRSCFAPHPLGRCLWVKGTVCIECDYAWCDL